METEILGQIVEYAGSLSALGLSLFMLVMFFRGQIVPKTVVESIIVEVVAEAEKKRLEAVAASKELDLIKIERIVTASEERVKDHITETARR